MTAKAQRTVEKNQRLVRKIARRIDGYALAKAMKLGLLYDLAQALTDLGLSIVTARVATYGERAVDAFYVRDAFGLKVTHETKLADIRKRLLALIAAADPVADAAQ